MCCVLSLIIKNLQHILNLFNVLYEFKEQQASTKRPINFLLGMNSTNQYRIRKKKDCLNTWPHM